LITFDKTIDMSTKQVLFRLDDSIALSFDSKLNEKGISKQFFFTKCVELFIDGSLNFDSNTITNDSEVQEIKKQLAVIMARLDKLENDSTVITNDNNNNDSDDIKLIAYDKTVDGNDVETLPDDDDKVAEVRKDDGNIYAKSLTNYAINTKATVVKEPKMPTLFDLEDDKKNNAQPISTDNLTLDVPENFTSSTVDPLPHKDTLDGEEKTKGSITPETSNKGIKNDSQREKREDLPQEFLELPQGKVTATQLAKVFEVSNGTVTNWAKQTQTPEYKDFWIYLAVAKNNKGKFVWEKIK